MKICYLGGAREVGASSILIKLSNYNILLDSGIRQKKNKDKLPDFSCVKDFGKIDAIIISHAHMDHIGSLPIISKEYPSVPIYMTKMTLDLMRVLLYDSLKIMNYTEGEIPIFKEDDVLEMLDRVKVIPFQHETEILKDLKLTLYMAGHIAGASCIHLKSKEGTLLYTGDYSLTHQHAISGLAIPKLRPDIVISESTYGDKLHSNREAEEMRLVETVKKIIEREGKALIPVFALGRSQEVLLILKKAFNKHQLPEIPIYVDGMVKNINRVFLNNPLFLKESLGKRVLKGQDIFYNDFIKPIEDKQEREKIVKENTPCIFIASSGMMSGGMSEYYASFLVENEKNGIILTGYQDEESNGSTLLKLLETEPEKRKIKLNEHTYNVLCSIDKVGLSAHADKQEMKSLLETLTPKHIVLGHGDTEIIDLFASELTKEIHSNIYAPYPSDSIEIEIKNPRKQIDYTLRELYAIKSDDFHDFYLFIKEKYQNRLFTKEDLAYIYYGKNPSVEEINTLTEQLIDSIYFKQDARRFFLFKISDELEIEEAENKGLTSQDIEEIIKEKFADFPYKKISFYLHENKVILTFDFPKVIDEKFTTIASVIKEQYGIIVEKNDNINTFACESKIKEIVGSEYIEKISYLPNEDKFKIKVNTLTDDKAELIKKEIGYDTEFVLTAKKTTAIPIIKATGTKMEQNEAFNYIDQFFNNQKDKPYKKGIKNGEIVLSFITYEVGSRYLGEIEKLESEVGYKISLNKSPNVNQIFQITSDLLNKYSIEKVSSPSYLPTVNKVSIKIKKNTEENINKLKEEYIELIGLELIVEEK